MSLLFPLGPPDDPAERDLRIMEIALREAVAAAARDEVPVGCVIVLENRILASAGNQVEQLQDATAHAEMLALTQAFEAMGSKRLIGAELYCTLEPCVMCTGAIVHARLSRVVYGAADPKFGGVCSLCGGFELEGLNHQVLTVGGVEAEASAELLRAFFQAKRQAKKGDRRT
ncbi:MAG: nucleoside deaminase [Planctomycetes bacterium]|nr:nucleoside deaminase [Planctomycetota bacterium]